MNDNISNSFSWIIFILKFDAAELEYLWPIASKIHIDDEAHLTTEETQLAQLRNVFDMWQTNSENQMN